jgi:hypothetical protein
MNHAFVSMAMPGAFHARQCFADKVKSTSKMQLHANFSVVMNLMGHGNVKIVEVFTCCAVFSVCLLLSFLSSFLTKRLLVY